MEELLKQWGLEELVESFEEHKIDIDTLRLLNEDTIKELIPKIGLRLKFLQCWKIFCSEVIIAIPDNETSCPLSVDEVNTLKAIEEDITFDIASPSTSSESSFAGCGVSEELVQDAVFGLTPRQRYNTPANKRRRRMIEKTNLKELLGKTATGRGVLSYFSNYKYLNNRAREDLVKIIIDHVLEEDINLKVDKITFSDFAEAIVAIFCTEIKELYYFEKRKIVNGKIHTIASGKLIRKYYNTRQKFKEIGVLTSAEAAKKQVEVINSKDFEDTLRWLRNSTEPWTEVEKKWSMTTKVRYQYLQQTPGKVKTYFEEYPALCETFGYTLLEQDFQTLFPTAKNFFTHLPEFCKKILVRAKQSNDGFIRQLLLKIEEETSSDKKYLRLLGLCPYLIKTSSIKKTSEKGTWRPSKIEVADGFILHIKTITELQRSIESKKNKLASLGVTLQPFPIVIGESLSEIKEAYVVIDDVFYKFNSALKAFDVCFKIIHSLHCMYPSESECVWLFVQKALYGFSTDWDNSYTTVNALLSDINSINVQSEEHLNKESNNE